jgi:hypothetical protein
LEEEGPRLAPSDVEVLEAFFRNPVRFSGYHLTSRKYEADLSIAMQSSQPVQGEMPSVAQAYDDLPAQPQDRTSSTLRTNTSDLPPPLMEPKDDLPATHISATSTNREPLFDRHTEEVITSNSASPGTPSISQPPKLTTQPANFIVHEYSPSNSIEASATRRKPVYSVPKGYTFANAGRVDYEPWGKAKKADAKEPHSTPVSRNGTARDVSTPDEDVQFSSQPRVVRTLDDLKIDDVTSRGWRNGPVAQIGSTQPRIFTSTRGDPPEDANGNYICEHSPDCEGFTFLRKSEWR